MKKFLQILVTAALAVMPAGAFADNLTSSLKNVHFVIN